MRHERKLNSALSAVAQELLPPIPPQSPRGGEHTRHNKIRHERTRTQALSHTFTHFHTLSHTFHTRRYYTHVSVCISRSLKRFTHVCVCVCGMRNNANYDGRCITSRRRRVRASGHVPASRGRSLHGSQRRSHSLASVCANSCRACAQTMAREWAQVTSLFNRGTQSWLMPWTAFGSPQRLTTVTNRTCLHLLRHALFE